MSRILTRPVSIIVLALIFTDKGNAMEYESSEPSPIQVAIKGHIPKSKRPPSPLVLPDEFRKASKEQVQPLQYDEARDMYFRETPVSDSDVSKFAAFRPIPVFVSFGGKLDSHKEAPHPIKPPLLRSQTTPSDLEEKIEKQILSIRKLRKSRQDVQKELAQAVELLSIKEKKIRLQVIQRDLDKHSKDLEELDRLRAEFKASEPPARKKRAVYPGDVVDEGS